MVDEAITELALLSLGRSLLHRRRTDRILVYGFAAVHLPVQDGHDGLFYDERSKKLCVRF